MVICFLMTHLGLLMRKVRIFFSKKQKKAPLRQKKTVGLPTNRLNESFNVLTQGEAKCHIHLFSVWICCQ